jgi:hypothetical protein
MYNSPKATYFGGGAYENISFELWKFVAEISTD